MFWHTTHGTDCHVLLAQKLFLVGGTLPTVPGRVGCARPTQETKDIEIKTFCKLFLLWTGTKIKRRSSAYAELFQVTVFTLNDECVPVQFHKTVQSKRGIHLFHYIIHSKVQSLSLYLLLDGTIRIKRHPPLSFTNPGHRTGVFGASVSCGRLWMNGRHSSSSPLTGFRELLDPRSEFFFFFFFTTESSSLMETDDIAKVRDKDSLWDESLRETFRLLFLRTLLIVSKRLMKYCVPKCLFIHKSRTIRQTSYKIKLMPGHYKGQGLVRGCDKSSAITPETSDCNLKVGARRWPTRWDPYRVGETGSRRRKYCSSHVF